MNERLAWADRLLAVVSPDYLAGTYSISEWTAMVWDDPDGKRGAVVPVIVRPTPDLPPLLAKLSRVDLTGVDEREARERVLTALRAPAPPAGKPAFEPVPPPEGERGPVQQPRFSDDAFVQDPNVGVVLDSSAATAAALDGLLRRLDDQQAAGTDAKSTERKQLKRLIRDLGFLAHMQYPVVDGLRQVVDQRDAASWGTVQHTLSNVVATVTGLVEFLADFEGDLVFRDLETFQQLQSMIMTRAGVYAELMDMPPPDTAEGWERLGRLADTIEHLLGRIVGIQERLSEYLAAGG